MREIVEVCPHCEAESNFEWDVKSMGYVSKCPVCNKEMFLCDECLHSEDNLDQKCNWHEEGEYSVCFRGKHLKE